MTEGRAEAPEGRDEEPGSVEQQQAGPQADPGDEAERAQEREEQADEGVLRDSDQGVGGQFE